MGRIKGHVIPKERVVKCPDSSLRGPEGAAAIRYPIKGGGFYLKGLGRKRPSPWPVLRHWLGMTALLSTASILQIVHSFNRRTPAGSRPAGVLLYRGCEFVNQSMKNASTSSTEVRSSSSFTPAARASAADFIRALWISGEKASSTSFWNRSACFCTSA